MPRAKFMLFVRGTPLNAQSVFGAYVGGLATDDPARSQTRDPDALAWTCVIDANERRVGQFDSRREFDYRSVRLRSDQLRAGSMLIYPFMMDGATTVLVAIMGDGFPREDLENVLREALSPLLTIVASVQCDRLVSERPTLVALKTGRPSPDFDFNPRRFLVISEFDELEVPAEPSPILAVRLAQPSSADGQFTSLGDAQELFVFERYAMPACEGCKAIVSSNLPLESLIDWLSTRTAAAFFQENIDTFDGMLLVENGEDDVSRVIFGPAANLVEESDWASAC